MIASHMQDPRPKLPSGQQNIISFDIYISCTALALAFIIRWPPDGWH